MNRESSHSCTKTTLFIKNETSNLILFPNLETHRDESSKENFQIDVIRVRVSNVSKVFP